MQSKNTPTKSPTYNAITIGDATWDTFLILDDATVNCDLKTHEYKLCLNYADKIPIRDTAQSVGGDAANVAAGLAHLGLKTAIVTELGDDMNGRIIQQELDDVGVDTHLVKFLKNKETRYAVVLNYKSERTILSYHAPRNYSLPKLPATQWIYYTSLGKTFEQVQAKLEVYLKKNSKTKLAINPGSYQLKKGLKKIKQLFPRTEILFLNKEEAELVAGKKTIEENLVALHRMGIHTIVITDSTKGSYAFDGTSTYFMKTYPIKPIAKTGAGDAYASGFLGATIHGETIEMAMRWGTANASGVIQQFGAQKGLLSKQHILKMIQTYHRIHPQRTAHNSLLKLPAIHV